MTKSEVRIEQLITIDPANYLSAVSRDYAAFMVAGIYELGITMLPLYAEISRYESTSMNFLYDAQLELFIVADPTTPRLLDYLYAAMVPNLPCDIRLGELITCI